MWKLAAIIFIIAAPTLAGIGALVPLTMFGVGEINAMAMLAGVAVGVVVAVPVSIWVAKRINDLIKPRHGQPA